MNKISLTVCSILLALSTQTTFAKEEHHVMKELTDPMNVEYRNAMNKMHKPMMEGIESKDPDVAFVKGMIAHHQGAVDMAKIELKYGKSVEMEKLAQEIIDNQEKQIAQMKQWLANHKTKE